MDTGYDERTALHRVAEQAGFKPRNLENWWRARGHEDTQLTSTFRIGGVRGAVHPDEEDVLYTQSVKTDNSACGGTADGCKAPWATYYIGVQCLKAGWTISRGDML